MKFPREKIVAVWPFFLIQQHVVIIIIIIDYFYYIILQYIMRKLENWECVMHLLEASEEGRGEADEMQNKN